MSADEDKPAAKRIWTVFTQRCKANIKNRWTEDDFINQIETTLYKLKRNRAIIFKVDHITPHEFKVVNGEVIYDEIKSDFSDLLNRAETCKCSKK